MKAKFSIRYKFLAAATALLVFCVGVYLWLATGEFTADKKSLVFDYNQTLVSNVSRELEKLLNDISDKIQIVTRLTEKKTNSEEEIIHALFASQEDVLMVGKTDRFARIDQVFYQKEQSPINPDLFLSHLKELQLNGEVLWNATTDRNFPQLGYGKSVLIENEKGIPVDQYGLIVLVRSDRLLKALESSQMNEVVVVGKAGEILVHRDPDLIFAQAKFNDELLAMALKDPLKKKVTEYQSGGKTYLGAFAKCLGGEAIVLSRVPEEKAFRAVYRLVFRSLLFASMVVTLAFIAAILFSRSITKPIDTLMQGMKSVSMGDLSGNIVIQSQDEIAQLAFSFNRMIADLKSSRDELESINKELENKVKARTRDLEMQNQAVKEAQEALLRSTRLAAVGEVAGQAAHEVLNPITSIIAKLRKLKGRVQDDRQKEIDVLFEIEKAWQQDVATGGLEKLINSWKAPSQMDNNKNLFQEDVQNIHEIGQTIKREYSELISDADFLIGESERIARIINSFRHLSAGKNNISRHSLNLLCDQSVKIMADLASKENVKLNFRADTNKDAVMIDEDNLIQVLTNLIRNSIHAVKSAGRDADAGKIEVVTSLKGADILVRVIDNGAGISKEHCSRLFEKNFTTKSRDDGSGIGLSISRRLIRAFRGDIELEKTEVGKGTTFCVRIPLAAEQDAMSIDEGAA